MNTSQIIHEKIYRIGIYSTTDVGSGVKSLQIFAQASTLGDGTDADFDQATLIGAVIDVDAVPSYSNLGDSGTPYFNESYVLRNSLSQPITGGLTDIEKTPRHSPDSIYTFEFDNYINNMYYNVWVLGVDKAGNTELLNADGIENSADTALFVTEQLVDDIAPQFDNIELLTDLTWNTDHYEIDAPAGVTDDITAGLYFDDRVIIFEITAIPYTRYVETATYLAGKVTLTIDATGLPAVTNADAGTTFLLPLVSINGGVGYLELEYDTSNSVNLASFKIERSVANNSGQPTAILDITKESDFPTWTSVGYIDAQQYIDRGLSLSKANLESNNGDPQKFLYKVSPVSIFTDNASGEILGTPIYSTALANVVNYRPSVGVAPSAVTVVDQANDTDGAITLTWDNAVDTNGDLRGYEIQRMRRVDSVPESWATIAVADVDEYDDDPGANDKIYIDSGLEPNKPNIITYEYQIRSFDWAGNISTWTSFGGALSSTDITAPLITNLSTSFTGKIGGWQGTVSWTEENISYVDIWGREAEVIGSVSTAPTIYIGRYSVDKDEKVTDFQWMVAPSNVKHYAQFQFKLIDNYDNISDASAWLPDPAVESETPQAVIDSLAPNIDGFDVTPIKVPYSEDIKIVRPKYIKDYNLEGYNLVKNGGFDTDTIWSKDSGWTIGSSKATSDGTASARIMQNGLLTIGSKYLVEFEITDYTSGILQLYDSVYNDVGDGLGKFSFICVPSVSTALYMRSSDTSPFIGSIDNVEVIELLAENLVINGAFDTDLSDWNVSNTTLGTYSWDAGRAKIVNDQAGDRPRIYQGFTTEIGKRYHVTGNGYIGDTTEIWLYTINGAYDALTTDGIFSYFFTATSTYSVVTCYSRETGNTGHYCHFDDISVKEVKYHPAIIDIDSSHASKDIVVDGGFDGDGSDWLFGTGWALSDGKVSGTSIGIGQSIIQDIGLVEGREYEVTFDTIVVSGNVRVYLYGSNQYGTPRSASGTYTERFIAGNGVANFSITVGSEFTGSVDNIIVKKFPIDRAGNGLTFTDVVSKDANDRFSMEFNNSETSSVYISSLAYDLTNDITLISWINFNVVDGQASHPIFMFNDTSHYFSVYSNSRLRLNNNGVDSLYTPTDSIVPNTWHFVVAARKSDGSADIYIDGIKQVLAGTYGVPDASTSARVGGGYGSLTYYNGLINRPRILHGILSDEQILDIYEKENYNFPIQIGNGNLVTNGTFHTDLTGWETHVGDTYWHDGKAYLSGTNPAIKNTISFNLLANKKYKISWTIHHGNYPTSDIYDETNGDWIVPNESISTDGDHYTYYTPVNDCDIIRFYVRNGDYGAWYDNISIIEANESVLADELIQKSIVNNNSGEAKIIGSNLATNDFGEIGISPSNDFTFESYADDLIGISPTHVRVSVDKTDPISGTCTGSDTNFTEVQDSTASWTIDEWIGWDVTINGEVTQISSNDATTLYLDDPLTGDPDTLPYGVALPDDLAGYNIFRGKETGGIIESWVLVTDTKTDYDGQDIFEVIDRSVDIGTYRYGITAYDLNNNESAPIVESEETVTITDVVAPGIPKVRGVIGGAGSLYIYWNRTSDDVAYYKLTISDGVDTTVLAETNVLSENFTLYGVIDTKNQIWDYKYKVVAYDASGNFIDGTTPEAIDDAIEFLDDYVPATGFPPSSPSDIEILDADVDGVADGGDGNATLIIDGTGIDKESRLLVVERATISYGDYETYNLTEDWNTDLVADDLKAGGGTGFVRITILQTPSLDQDNAFLSDVRFEDVINDRVVAAYRVKAVSSGGMQSTVGTVSEEKYVVDFDGFDLTSLDVSIAVDIGKVWFQFKDTIDRRLAKYEIWRTSSVDVAWDIDTAGVGFFTNIAIQPREVDQRWEKIASLQSTEANETQTDYLQYADNDWDVHGYIDEDDTVLSTTYDRKAIYALVATDRWGNRGDVYFLPDGTKTANSVIYIPYQPRTNNVEKGAIYWDFNKGVQSNIGHVPISNPDAILHKTLGIEVLGDLKYNIDKLGGDYSIVVRRLEKSFSALGLGLTDIVDTFIYDTRTDTISDEWRFDSTKSWYSETFSATRGGTMEFPEVTLLIATKENLYIYDYSTGNLWMTFNTGTSAYIYHATSSNFISFVSILNGLLIVTVDGASGTINVIDFVNDKHWQGPPNYHIILPVSGRNNTDIGNRVTDSGYYPVSGFNRDVQHVISTIINDNHYYLASTGSKLFLVRHDGTDSMNLQSVDASSFVMTAIMNDYVYALKENTDAVYKSTLKIQDMDWSTNGASVVDLEEVLLPERITGGKNLSFDGTDDYMNMSNIMDGYVGSRSFEIVTNNLPVGIHQGLMGYTTSEGYSFYSNGGIYVDTSGYFTMVCYDGIDYIYAKALGNPGNRNHIVGIYDADTMEASIYLNGIRNETSGLSANISSINGNSFIGRNSRNTNPYYTDGGILLANTYNRVLTPSEVVDRFLGKPLPDKDRWGKHVTFTFASDLEGWLREDSDESSALTHSTDHANLAVTSTGTSGLHPYIYPPGSSIPDSFIGKLVKFKFDYTVNSGTCILSVINLGISDAIYETLTGTGVFEIEKVYSRSTGDLLLYFDGTNLFDIDIDNVSVIKEGCVLDLDIDNTYTSDGTDDHSSGDLVIPDLSDNGNDAIQNTYDSKPLLLDLPPKHTLMDISKYTKALSYDGVNQQSIVTDDPSINFGVNSFSVSVHTKTTQLGTTEFVLSKADSASASTGIGYSIYLGNAGSDWTFGVWDGSYNLVNAAVDFTVNKDEWTHILGIFDSTTKTSYIYINGILLRTLSNALIGDIDVSEDLIVGGLGSRWWEGDLSHVRLFNSALTQADVLNLYRTGEIPSHLKDNCVLDLSPESIQEGEWTDLSGNDNHAVPTNGPVVLDNIPKPIKLTSNDDKVIVGYKSTLDKDGQGGIIILEEE